jgi:hypothetical protein
MKLWLKGLIAAFIGGAANAGTNILIAPTTFNFQDGAAKLSQAALASGIFAMCFYLKKSPLPDDATTQINVGGNATINQPAAPIILPKP